MTFDKDPMEVSLLVLTRHLSDRRITPSNVVEIKDILDKIESGEKPIVRIVNEYATSGDNPIPLDEKVENPEVLSAYFAAGIDPICQYISKIIEPEWVSIDQLNEDNPGQLYTEEDISLGRVGEGISKSIRELLESMGNNEEANIPYLFVAKQPDGRFFIDDTNETIFYALRQLGCQEIPCIVREKDLTAAYLRKRMQKELETN